MTQNINDLDDCNSQTPFEGPEKLLEIWFAPSEANLECEDPSQRNKCGLRAVPVAVWESMLDIVKCKILSTVNGREIDAYLLSESSFFVWPHKLILKTCGRTLNLLGVPRILAIASEYAGLRDVYQLFYSRKSFMFPQHQIGPHRDWTAEVEFLDEIFKKQGGGSAYTVGRVNGDHWLLYVTGPGAAERDESDLPDLPALDYTVEILMSDLQSSARAPFFFPNSIEESECAPSSSGYAQQLSVSSGISTFFPPHVTTLDAYAFDPCGYSSNALIQWESVPGSPRAKQCPSAELQHGEGYYTIHVTPEEGYSYASFECNVALPSFSPDEESSAGASRIPDLRTLVQRVVQTFQPGRLTLTVFMSSSSYQDAEGDTEIEAAQKAFQSALQTVKFDNALANGTRYKRTDKINYEFGGYDLAFATFERKCGMK